MINKTEQSDSPAPDVDAAERMAWAGEYMVPTEVARKLERERDEANYFLNELAEVDGQLKLRINELCEVLQKTEKDLEFRRGLYKVQEQYLEAARAELAEWKDSAKNVRKEFEDEHHCSCVAILRKLLKDAERERDEARSECARLRETLAVTQPRDFGHFPEWFDDAPRS
jgi:hypothetical protein